MQFQITLTPDEVAELATEIPNLTPHTPTVTRLASLVICQAAILHGVKSPAVQAVFAAEYAHHPTRTHKLPPARRTV